MRANGARKTNPKLGQLINAQLASRTSKILNEWRSKRMQME